MEVGGLFYAAWGKNQSTQEVYDPQADTWAVVGALPANLSHVQGVVVGGRIFYIGGFAFDPTRDVGTVYIFDPSANAWSMGAPMPAGRERGAGGVAVWDGKIYYLGGMHGHVAVPWVDVYDPATGSWTSLPDMPHARDHLAVAIVDGSIYAIGGRLGDPTLPVAATDRYDIAQGSWTTGLAPIPTPRAGMGIAQLGDELLISGGSDDYVSLRDVDAYDIASDTWHVLAPVPTARDGVQAVVWRGDVYVMGGGTLPKGTGPTDVLEVYIPESTVRPDLLVGPATAGPLLGDDIYNLTGLGQSTTSSAARGATRTFRIQIENDGSTPEAYTVRGSPAASHAFTVKYLRGATGTADVTQGVVAGTYTTAVLAPGASVLLRLRVRVDGRAARRAVQATSMSVASTTRPTSRDVVAATVTVK